MGVRMLLINPLGTDMFDGITVDLVQPHLAADTEVVCRSLGDGVPRTPFLAPPASYRDPLVTAVAAAADQGFDVVGISCCGDPALADCKAASRIPVTAPMEATAAASTALGPVCIVQRKLPAVYAERMPTQRDNTWMRDMMRRYGMPDERVELRQVPVSEHPSPEEVSDMVERDPDGLRERILEAMAHAVDGPGVELAQQVADGGASSSILFACTFWGGLLDTVRKSTSLNVIDPLVVVAKYAECLAVVA